MGVSAPRSCPLRAYRWNEDGIAGICDRHQHICFALALWNEKDPILKERIFGLTGNEGNHGEDVKEYYFYLDSTPTHSYMKYLYKYPQAEFPYAQLVEENRRRGKNDPEFELMDTGVFEEDRYFDVVVEYAKASPEDMLIRISATNRGPSRRACTCCRPSGFATPGRGRRKPSSRSWRKDQTAVPDTVINIDHPTYGRRYLYLENKPSVLFTENETNSRRLYDAPGPVFCKDGINDFVVNGGIDAVNPDGEGTKAAPDYGFTVAAGETVTVKLRLTDQEWPAAKDPLNGEFDRVFLTRKLEADEFYARIIPEDLSDDAQERHAPESCRAVVVQAVLSLRAARMAGGRSRRPAAAAERKNGRNHDWTHLYNADVISMPDKWEYPWYAAWDLAFHCVPLALVDAEFAKEQLVLLTREWYMHPNGQLPAYEWALGDVNPPVHAWAAWRVYKIDKKQRGRGDRAFLVRVFHKLMLNFTWWVNRKDAEGMNIFQGGFLGLDNIGVFDRSAPLPTGGHLEQSDGTSWMAMYTLNLLAIAFELAKEDPAYEDVASKFWEHFLYIANAMCHRGSDGQSLWNEEDGFFYDVLHAGNDERFPMKVRSMVGLIPLFAVETLDSDLLDRMPSFKRRMEWFIENRPDLTANLACMRTTGEGERRLMSIVDAEKLRRILKYMLDENEFLSPYGIRALSRHHEANPYVLNVGGAEHRVDYEPGESRTGLFGGNSNWRGPIWFPVNFLLVEALQRFHYYLGDDFKVECPTGSGQYLTLWEVAAELSRRMSNIFTRDDDGRRPVYGDIDKFQYDENWNDLILFHEYFHGDTGAGVGASHQTGWTGAGRKTHATKRRKEITIGRRGCGRSCRLTKETNTEMKAIAVFPARATPSIWPTLKKPSVNDVPNGRGVLVRILKVGVDGTDKEINAAEYGAAPNGYEFLVIGHEGFGQVEEVGPNVTEFKPGDYVVATVRRPGNSIYDKIGTYDMTTDDDYFERGISRLHGFLTEYYVDDPEYIVKIPQGLKDVAVLLEPMTVVQKGIVQAYEIQRRLKVWRPRTAAVMGAGTIGLLATLVLRLRGLDVDTFARSPKPSRNADLIESLGAHYHATQQLPFLECAKECGPYDIIFEATGNSAVVFDAMQGLAKNGVLVLASVTGGDKTIEIPCRPHQPRLRSRQQGDGGYGQCQPRVLRVGRARHGPGGGRISGMASASCSLTRCMAWRTSPSCSANSPATAALSRCTAKSPMPTPSRNRFSTAWRWLSPLNGTREGCHDRVRRKCMPATRPGRTTRMARNQRYRRVCQFYDRGHEHPPLPRLAGRSAEAAG